MAQDCHQNYIMRTTIETDFKYFYPRHHQQQAIHRL